MDKLHISAPSARHDPYTDQTPSEILQREMRIDSFSLTVNSQHSLFPFEKLVANPVISTYLSNFEYIRSDLKVRIEVSSSPMQYGTLMVSVVPYSPQSDTFTVHQQSQLSCHLLDVTTNEAIEITLPYLRPQNFHRKPYPNDGSSKDWRVIVTLLTFQTLTLDTSTSVSVNVFASMVKPHVAGFIMESVPEEGVFQSGYVSSLATSALSYAASSAFKAGSKVIEKKFEETTTKTAANWWDTFFSEETPQNQGEQASLSLLGDVTAPVPHSDSSLVNLGDGAPHSSRLPGTNTVHKIGEIVTRPTYLSSYVVSSSSVQTFDPSPLNTLTYSGYFSRMFKYWKGSQRVLLRFVGSPLFVARVAVALFPVSRAGLSYDPILAFGNTPCWEISVCGTHELIVDVPYLAVEPWQLCENTTFSPRISWKLMEPIVQPFDKTVSLTVEVYYCCGSDFIFAGLQSASSDTLEGEFQSLIGKMAPSSSPKQDYMGCDMNVYNILSRYSSMPIPSDVTPFPFVEYMPSYHAWNQTLDNFLWIVSLYKFWSGTIKTKMLFTASSEQPVVTVGMSNTRQTSPSDALIPGNSLAITHQSVWPALQVTVPYMDTLPYRTVNTADVPAPQWGLAFSDPSTLSTLYVSAGHDFALSYLMCVPTHPPEGDFQATCGPLYSTTSQYEYFTLPTTTSTRRIVTLREHRSLEEPLSSYFVVDFTMRFVHSSGTGNVAVRFVSYNGNDPPPFTHTVPGTATSVANMDTYICLATAGETAKCSFVMSSNAPALSASSIIMDFYSYWGGSVYVEYAINVRPYNASVPSGLVPYAISPASEGTVAFPQWTTSYKPK